MPEPHPSQGLMSTTVTHSGTRDLDQALHLCGGTSSCLTTRWGGSSAVIQAGTTTSQPFACTGGGDNP